MANILIFEIFDLIRLVTCTACTTPRCAKPTENNGCSNITSLPALAKLAGFLLDRDVENKWQPSTSIFVCLSKILKFRKGWKTNHELVPTRPPEKVMSALKVGYHWPIFLLCSNVFVIKQLSRGNQLRRLPHDRKYSHPKYI